MTVKELREALEAFDDEAEVTVDVENIPGLGTLFGAFVAEVADGDGYVTLAATAP